MAKRWHCALCHAAPPDVARSTRKKALCDVCYDGLIARGLAWCTIGQHRVAAADLSKRGYQCRACDAAQQRARYGKERARRLERQRGYDAARAEARREADRRRRPAANARRRARYATDPAYATQRRATARRTANLERARQRSAAWRAANRDRAAAHARAWRARQKLRILQSWRRV